MSARPLDSWLAFSQPGEPAQRVSLGRLGWS